MKVEIKSEESSNSLRYELFALKAIKIVKII